MLTPEIAKKINDFVYVKPRTIDEIANHIKKNWRTANRYVESIQKHQGNLAVRVFREGTRGALKIVYWANIENIHSTSLQERLFRKIEIGRTKEDFSPSEIYQYVNKNKKRLSAHTYASYVSKKNFDDFCSFLRGAQKQISFFSGNLTWSNMAYHDKKILQIVEELAKKNVIIKILTRVELAGIDNIKNILSINSKIGKEMVEVRHCYQPLRATIVDNKSARFKEILKKQDYAKGELKEDTYLLYEILDKEWVEWLQKIFWNLFNASISAEKRIEELEIIKRSL
ncbi:MAG: hypothetical protein QXP53_00895 [Candidatus Pacearchaeota archaeon]